MISERKIATALVSLAMAMMLAPGYALAATFTKPVLLPGRGSEERAWHFAVNDRGQAVAVTGSPHGTLIYPIRSSGRIGRPWLLRIPGGYSPDAESVTVDDRGRIAVALTYDDGSYVPKEEHDVGCCLHAAIATWQLGAQPPMAQVISLPDEPQAPSLGELEVPQVVIGPHAVTALWTTGGASDNLGDVYAGNVDEAFGPFGSTLRSSVLIRAPHGIAAFHLALASNGRPVASWISNRRHRLGSVIGSPTGALPSPTHTQTVPHLSIEVGLSSDIRGTTAFTYWGTNHTLMMMVSNAGGHFYGPRTLVRAVPTGGDAKVVLGGGELLATWGCLEPSTRCQNHAHARRGSLSGSLGRVFTLPEQTGNPAGFIDKQRRTVLVYDSPDGIAAITASAGGAFSHAQQVARHLRQCGLDDDSATYNVHSLQEEPSYAASANGNAIVGVRCEELSEYLVRYTP